MPEAQFDRMRRIIAAPSPIGLEAAMTRGVLEPLFREVMPSGWAIHTFRGNAGIVCDTHPGRDDLTSFMLVGHADKIRLQVRSLGDDGKVWVDSESFLPAALIGHEVRIFSERLDRPGSFRVTEGGTIEAVGAIHFAKSDLRSGTSGITPEMLFIELQVHGEDRKKQVEALGIRPGDPILLHRPIRRGVSPDTFYGAYLDNGLGCFVAEEVARQVAAAGGTRNLRVLFAIASHEEVGRLGSRVLAQTFRPDLLASVDVSHDYEAAPGVGDKRLTPVRMGRGFSLSHGSITSAFLNSLIEATSRDRGIPCQRRVVGKDTGNDAMAAVFASVDAAASAIGFPIRNMHTISEAGHTGDVLSAIHALVAVIERLDGWNGGRGLTRADLREGHPRLDLAGE
jgi:endoglucanase